jgi:ADP-ribose pyrophosphatase YjhB (NUDIX family)
METMPVSFGDRVPDAGVDVRVNVGVVLRDASGAILLEKRRDCGQWGIPGGRIEPGESIRAAASREMLEETGFQTNVTRIVGVYSDPADGRIVTFPDTVVQIVDVIVEAEIVGGELAISDESEAMVFFDPGALPRSVDVIPPARRVLHDIVSGARGVIA